MSASTYIMHKHAIFRPDIACNETCADNTGVAHARWCVIHLDCDVKDAR
jgi:hypothetical protein